MAFAAAQVQAKARELRGLKRGNTGNGGGRVAKGSQGHRAWPMVLTVHLPLTAGDDDDRHLPGH